MRAPRSAAIGPSQEVTTLFSHADDRLALVRQLREEQLREAAYARLVPRPERQVRWSIGRWIARLRLRRGRRPNGYDPSPWASMSPARFR